MAAFENGRTIAGYLDRQRKLIMVSERFPPATQRFTAMHEVRFNEAGAYSPRIRVRDVEALQKFYKLQ